MDSKEKWTAFSARHELLATNTSGFAAFVFNVETELYLLALISLCIYSNSLTWGW